MRVVPGQIKRHDKLYDQIDEKTNPWLTHRDQFDDDETTSVVVLLGANPLLQLAVEETINASSVAIRLVVFPENNTYTGILFIGHYWVIGAKSNIRNLVLSLGHAS